MNIRALYQCENSYDTVRAKIHSARGLGEMLLLFAWSARITLDVILLATGVRAL